MRVDEAQIDNDTFIDRWIDEVEANGIVCGGGGGGRSEDWSFVVSCHADLDGSRKKRARIEQWLRAQPSVVEWTLPPVYADLTRAFHSSPQAALRQQKINKQRGIGSEIARG